GEEGTGGGGRGRNRAEPAAPPAPAVRRGRGTPAGTGTSAPGSVGDSSRPHRRGKVGGRGDHARQGLAGGHVLGHGDRVLLLEDVADAVALPQPLAVGTGRVG